MSKIELLNEKTLEEFKKIEDYKQFSRPLLVSDKDLKESKIMYIGQEPNFWGNVIKEESLNSKLLEELYINYLRDMPDKDKDFWTFAKLLSDDEKVSDSIIWSNIFLAGDKKHTNLPTYYEKIEDLSMRYLLEVYDILKPEMVVAACGAANPYARLFRLFAKEAGFKIKGFPTFNRPVVSSSDGNCFWTYNPNLLIHQGIKDEVCEKIKIMHKYRVK